MATHNSSFIKYFIFIILGLFLAINIASSAESLTTEIAHTNNNQKILQVFVRDGCPHCAAFKEYLPIFSDRHPELKITLRSLDLDPDAANDLITISKKAGVWPPGVPTFAYKNKVIVGFGSPEISSPDLELLISDKPVISHQLNTNIFGTIDVKKLGLPVFTLALGLIDGFNPCAMWVLLFLLSLLVRLNDRKRMALIAGTFVIVSGAVYYAFMIAWLNIFLLIGLSAIVRFILSAIALTVGLINIRDFFSNKRGFTLSIPDAAKPGIYSRVRKILQSDKLTASLLGVTLLAIIVNFVELMCTAGIPAIYTAVLTEQGLSSSAYYGYIGLYILGYIADDALMVTIAVIALSSKKLTETAGRWLKLISGLVMFVIGIVLLIKPSWLF